jgi:HSP20 family protein
MFDESWIRPRNNWVRTTTGYLPVDMYQTEEDIRIKATMPGVDPDDIDISVTGDVLTISGKVKGEEETEDGTCISRERYHGLFQRSLLLPTLVVADEAETIYEHGVLNITLPKAEEAKPRTIKVKAVEDKE